MHADDSYIIRALAAGARAYLLKSATDEDLLPTEHEKVFMVRNHAFARAAFQRDLEALRALVLARNRDGAVRHLRRMAGLDGAPLAKRSEA